MKAITRTIWVLSLVSLFNDIASEMLLPIMPLYLKSIGFSIMLIGVLEGLAEATASLSKGYFGKMSDNIGERMPFVRWGYMLSAVSKPMMGLLIQPVWVFFSRTLDRLGKGVRTAARDAILSDESAHGDRGKVFGFNRALDTVGATIGPALALLFLYLYHGEYRSLFYISFFPGVVAVALTFVVREKKTEHTPSTKKRVPFFAQFKYWRESPVVYKKLVIGLLFFALFNSSDAFLILKMKEAGTGDLMVIVVYVFYNLVYALTSFPIGIMADKVGLKQMLLIGLLIFGMVYLGMAFLAGKVVFGILFLFYGLYYACTDGIAKAWVSKICDKKDTATALGVFSGLQSICSLLASAVAGFVWYEFGSVYVFIAAGVASILACIYIGFIKQVHATT
jgi:MFS family permease